MFNSSGFNIPKYLRNLKGLNSSASEIDNVVKRNFITSKIIDQDNFNSVHKITSDATAPSYTGMTLLTGVLNGYGASFTCNSTNGSNILTNISSLNKLYIGQYLKESTTSSLLPTSIPVGAKIVSIDNVNNTITINKNCLASTIGVTTYGTLKGISYEGGVPTGYNNNLFVSGATATSATPSSFGVGYALEFYTDAGNFTTSTYSIVIKSYRSGTTPNSYRVAIDDVYDTDGLVSYLGADNGFLKIQFNTIGIHKVRVEFQQRRLFQSFYLINGAKIWEVEKKPNIVFFGDSWFGGQATDTLSNFNTIGYRVAQDLNCNIINASVGGTGYIAKGGTNFNWQKDYRLNDVLVVDDAKALVIFGSINDAGNTEASLITASLYVWQQLRVRLPNIPFFICGVPTTINTSSVTASALEIALKKAFIQFNDSNSFFIPITTDEIPWIDDLNKSVYVGGDGNHLKNIGGKYFSNKISTKIRTTMNEI